MARRVCETVARHIRPRRRNRLLIAALVAVAPIASAPAFAQTRDDYHRLIDSYVEGRVQDAIAELGRWPTDVVGELARQPYLGDSRPVVMLHTELAAAAINIDSSRATFHLDLARRRLGAIAAHKDQDPAAMAFVRHWYDFAPSIYLLAGDNRNAWAYVHQGLVATPGVHPLLYFYRAVGVEAQAHRNPRSAMTARGTAIIVERVLSNAATDLLRALSEDEHLACARLHLGWIHFQQRDSRARKDLQTALSDAGDDASTRYLAHLFLGAIDERENRLADALREYEQAKAVNPRYQTSYIALMRVAEGQGDTARARNEAQAFGGIEKLDDPWWNYLGGFNLPVLEWLRAASRSH
jgi:tetratricopeptide (TPR) repeat protein